MALSFSISVPVGAWHPFLPACLASLAAQKVDLKVSLLDASRDERVSEIANRFAGFLHYRRHGPDGGQSAAILEGWAKAPGEVLGWLNADDILMPGALERARGAFSGDPSLDLVYGHSTILDEAGRMVGYHWAVEPPNEVGPPRIYEAGVISQPSCFFKRKAYEAAGGLDEDLHYTMDWDLWVRLEKSGAKAGFIDAPLSMVLWGDETKTASFNAQRRAELKRIIETYAPEDKRKKIFRAFALHNLMNRVKPEGLKKAVTRALHRGQREIYGLSADGLVRPGAKVFLAHYEETPRESVRFSFENAAGGVAVECGEPISISHPDPKTIDIAFEKPVEAARTIKLSLEPPASAKLRFRSAEWR